MLLSTEGSLSSPSGSWHLVGPGANAAPCVSVGGEEDGDLSGGFLGIKYFLMLGCLGPAPAPLSSMLFLFFHLDLDKWIEEGGDLCFGAFGASGAFGDVEDVEAPAFDGDVRLHLVSSGCSFMLRVFLAFSLPGPSDSVFVLLGEFGLVRYLINFATSTF